MTAEFDPSGGEEVSTEGGEELLADDTSESSEESVEETQAQTQTQQIPATQSRQAVFTPQQQELVNNIVRNRLREERLRWERERNGGATAAASATRQPIRETPSTPSFDPQTRAALDAYLEAQLAPYRSQVVKSEIDGAFSEFQSKHPELSDKATRDQLIETILSWGEDLVQRAPMNWLLEQGWLAMKYGAFDEKTFKEAAVQEYLASKGDRARRVPTAQGSGGKATTTPKPRGKEWKDADAAMRSLIEEENAARA